MVLFLFLLTQLIFIFLTICVMWLLGEIEKKEKSNVDIFYCGLSLFFILLLVFSGFINYGVFMSVFPVFYKLNYQFIIVLFSFLLVLNWITTTVMLIVVIDEGLRVIKNKIIILFFMKLRKILIFLNFLLFIQNYIKIFYSFLKKINFFSIEDKNNFSKFSTNNNSVSDKYYRVSEFCPCNYKYYHHIKISYSKKNMNYDYTIVDLWNNCCEILNTCYNFTIDLLMSIKNLNFIDWKWTFSINNIIQKKINIINILLDDISFRSNYNFCYFLKKLNISQNYIQFIKYKCLPSLDYLLSFISHSNWTILTFMPFVFLFSFIFYHLISIYSLIDFKEFYYKNKPLSILDFFLAFSCSLCFVGLMYGGFYYFIRNNNFFNINYDYALSGDDWKNNKLLNFITILLLSNPHFFLIGFVCHYLLLLDVMFKYLLQPASQRVHNNFTILCSMLIFIIIFLDFTISFELAPLLFFWAIIFVYCIYVWLYFQFFRNTSLKYKIISIVSFYFDIIFLIIIGFYFFFMYNNISFFIDSLDKTGMVFKEVHLLFSGASLLKLASVTFFVVFFFISILLSIVVDFLYSHLIKNNHVYKQISYYTKLFNILKKLTYALTGFTAFTSCCRFSMFLLTMSRTELPTLLHYITIFGNISFVLINLILFLILLIFIYLLYKIILKG